MVKMVVRRDGANQSHFVLPTVGGDPSAIPASVDHVHLPRKSHTLLATHYWLLATGCWLLTTGCWLLTTGCWLLTTGCRLLTTGCWLLTTGCWLLTTCTPAA